MLTAEELLSKVRSIKLQQVGIVRQLTDLEKELTETFALFATAAGGMDEQLKESIINSVSKSLAELEIRP